MLFWIGKNFDLAARRRNAARDEAALLAQTHADLAFEWLKQAIKTGWTDAVQINKDSDPNSLRDRDDSKALAAELEK